MTASPIILAAFAAVPVLHWYGGSLIATPDNKIARIWMRGVLPFDTVKTTPAHEFARAARDRYYAELCDRIVRLRKAGMSISDIAARVGRARSTVGETLRRRGEECNEPDHP